VFTSLDFDPSEGFEEEFDLYDEYEENAETRILEVLSQHQVVTDRELKVRLEREFFPWVVGARILYSQAHANFCVLKII